MEAAEYRILFELESTYWWHRHLHATLAELLASIGVGETARILDAGCGTGGLIDRLSRSSRATVFGVDSSPLAARFWTRKSIRRAAVASINQLPLADRCFDAAVAVDVLECQEVDEMRAIAELWRVLRPGGHMLLVVPAYRWLLTRAHHAAVHATRRYSVQDVHSLLLTRPFEIVRVTHLFAPLFPLIAAYRLGIRAMERVRTPASGSELRPLPGLVNEGLYRIAAIERRILRHGNLPVGTSIVAIAQKREAPSP